MSMFENLLSCLPCAPEYILDEAGLMHTPLAPLFEKMAGTKQEPEWHGEGDVWTHTCMVCRALAQLPDFRGLPLRSQQELQLAALLHDIAKPYRSCLEDGRIAAPGHASAGAQDARRLLWQDFGLSGDAHLQNFRETVCLLIRYHSLPLHLLDNHDPQLRARRVAQNAVLAPDFNLHMLCLLAQADVLGRICDDQQELLDEIALSMELAKDAQCLTKPYEFACDCTRYAYLGGRDVWPGQELYDDSWGEVILMCGLPGTGKDSWIREHYPDLPVVCLDDIRRQMGVKATDEQGSVVQAAREQARIYLRAKQSFIWNATCITPLIRSKAVKLFEDYHASVRIVYLETEWQENLRRNAGRVHTVPEVSIQRMLDHLIPPEACEARRVEWICI